jgi:hypothetical protein
MTEPFPFTEHGYSRVFSAAVDESELQWHWDEEDRLVSAECETDWKIQLDNQLPQPFLLGLIFHIRAGEYHRLIKGTGELRIAVIKNALPPK